MLAPLASGVPSVIVPAASEVLNPPPFGCVGDVSTVVPFTVIEHGAAAGAHVAASLIPLTTTSAEVIARTSATVPPALGKLLMSIMRKRSRVTLAPVLFVNLLRNDNVPFVELFAGFGVRSRVRFGGNAADAD